MDQFELKIYFTKSLSIMNPTNDSLCEDNRLKSNLYMKTIG